MRGRADGWRRCRCGPPRRARPLRGASINPQVPAPLVSLPSRDAGQSTIVPANELALLTLTRSFVGQKQNNNNNNVLPTRICQCDRNQPRFFFNAQNVQSCEASCRVSCTGDGYNCEFNKLVKGSSKCVLIFWCVCVDCITCSDLIEPY